VGCDPDNESDFLVIVKATSLTYYEVLCELKKATAASDNSFSGRFDCSEEDSRWVQDVSMKLDNGKLIHQWAGRKSNVHFRCK